MKKILAGCLMTIALGGLSGCETLAPERSACAKLMGKPIDEAFKVFGRPAYVGPAVTIPPGSKFQEQTFYRFEKLGSQYDETNLVGSHMDLSMGAPTHVDEYETKHIQEACNIGIWADTKTKIIDYYEVQGDCGLGGQGLGNTGMFHYWGIN